MIKYRMIYILMTIVLIVLTTIGMAPKQKKDISHYLGKSDKDIELDVQAVIKQKGISFVKDKDNEIMEIQLLDKDYQINGISVGDAESKVYEIYPEDWIVKDANHIWVGMGNTNHFGITTQYIIFILDDKSNIQEIRLGYTTEFTKMALPISNQIADDLLQGTWLSDQNRTLVFNKGILTDNILDNLWDRQYYTVIQPNEILIRRTKESQSEKVKMNFWIYDSVMYLFAIDDRGVPIEKSIETFIKKN